MRIDTDAPQLQRRHIYQFIYKHRTFIDLINCETVQIYDNDVKTAHTIRRWRNGRPSRQCEEQVGHTR